VGLRFALGGSGRGIDWVLGPIAHRILEPH
jgi:hypothetical protein